MPVRALLWDADGVLQTAPPAWGHAFVDVLGERADEIGTEIFTPLGEALAGRLAMREHVAAVLAAYDMADRTEPLLAVWRLIDPVPESRALVASLDLPSYLATNQDDWREVCMRTLMGYDDLLAGSYYSCALGVAKPDAGFFTAILADLVLAPDEVLFVDDNADNVAGARDVGLRAEQWVHTDGIEVLTGLLAGHGVTA